MSNTILSLMNKLFRKDKFTIHSTESLENRLIDISEKIVNIFDNNFLQTSTWGLDIFEKELDLPNSKTKSLDERRSIISAKWKGVGTLTLELIKNTVNSYIDGDVEVTFDGSINIKFIGMGANVNLESIYNTIEEIKPAHLPVNYTFECNISENLYVSSVVKTATTFSISDNRLTNNATPDLYVGNLVRTATKHNI